MLDRHVEAQRYAMLCAGQVAAAVYNVHRADGSEPLGATDFVPGLRHEPTEEEKLEQFKAFFDGLKAQQEAAEKARAILKNSAP